MVLQHLIARHLMIISPYDSRIIAGEDIRMNHPPEHILRKASARGLALLFAGDAEWAEYGPSASSFSPSLLMAA